mmetsp:Transcript_19481/g.56043  ORF Transcript_19481/g.56043 Transcript_19481/m.56043 type:complete len:634 (-) Transcript_19481:45-1946(-)
MPANTSSKKKFGSEGDKSAGGKRKFDGGNNASAAGGGGDSEQSASNKKRALKHERQSHRRHADAVVVSKEIWNKLRLKTNTKKETQDMTDELMELLRGKFAQVAMQHDASRVVQAVLQYGTPQQRLEVVKELANSDVAGSGKKGSSTNSLAELCKVQYAHFAVLKIIKYCYKDKECVKIAVKSLKGQVSKLAVHAVGARVIELLFSTFPPKSTALLKLELYGPQFALFASGDLSNVTSNHPTLEKVIEQQPKKRDAALEYVLGILNKGMEKNLWGFAYFQQLFSEYVTSASPNDVRAITSSVVDHSIHMLSTRAGTRVVAECATYGTPKDRKRIMKSLKGYTRSSLLHRDAYLALLRLIDVTDDTVAINKSVLAELQVNPDAKGNDDEDGAGSNLSPILDLATSDTGSKLFLLLLSSSDETRRRYFDPMELEVLRTGATIQEGGEDIPTSKKNADTRRTELLQYVRSLLIELCAKHPDELLRSTPGSRVLREVVASFPSQELVDAIVGACKESMNGESDELSIFEDRTGQLALKHLLLDEAGHKSDDEEEEEEEDADRASFAAALQSTFSGKLVQIASSNRGCFVLVSLLKVESVKKDVLKELKKNESKIKKAAGKNEMSAGYEALLKAIKEG